MLGEQETRRSGPENSPTDSGRENIAPAGSRFQANEIVANRYRIVRFIGQGGMGEVYEAEDLELSEKVALKTIRAQVGETERAVALFKREIQLARNVTHPNVCRIFDIGYHRAGKSGEDVTFLTMELLKGDTLAERLCRMGRLTTQQALPLVVQMAAALDAAHKAGIVHGDFKSSNVILVPSPQGLRAVVTDFGLARRNVTAEGSAHSSSTTGSIVGTPNYMSPEQVRGTRITPASDIYALGIVVFEMITAKLPFEGDTPLSAAVKRLEEPPVSPRKHVPDLDPKWNAAILRCLDRNPQGRFSSTGAFLRALGAQGAQGQVSRARLRWAVAIGMFVAVVAISAWFGFRLLHAPKGTFSLDPGDPNAAVYVDGELEGHGAVHVTLAAGSHNYVVREQGRPPTRGTFDVKAGSELDLVIVPSQESQHAGLEVSGPSASVAGPSGNSRLPQAQAAPRPAAAAPQNPSPTNFATLAVKSDPNGAQITIDGKTDPGWVTPYVLPNLGPGLHDIILSKEGYKTAQEHVRLEAGGTLPLSLTLVELRPPVQTAKPQPARPTLPPPATPSPAAAQQAESAPTGTTPGILKVETVPPGIEIVVDGKSWGPSPAERALPPGMHQIALRENGELIFKTSKYLNKGSVTSVAFRLTN